MQRQMSTIIYAYDIKNVMHVLLRRRILVRRSYWYEDIGGTRTYYVVLSLLAILTSYCTSVYLVYQVYDWMERRTV